MRQVWAFARFHANFIFQFNISRTLTQSAAAWLATKQAGNLNDLKRETEEETVSEKKTILVIRIGGTSASGEYSFFCLWFLNVLLIRV